MSDQMKFPARPLFDIVANGMAANVLRTAGPFGERSMAAPKGGEFRGDRISGTIVPNLANEWQIKSGTQAGLSFVQGLITLTTGAGDAILMKYVGRRSAFYADSWRIGACFEADGAADWLNDVVAAGRVEVVGDDLRFSLHELLGRKSPIDDHSLDTEPLYTMAASGSVGERFKINSPIGGRYLSVADSGCDTQGRLQAHWPAGFSWGAHRTGLHSAEGMGFPFHIDLTVGLVAEDGATIFQSYIGTNSRELVNRSPDIDRSWRTIAMFEAPADGPHAYLNEVIALGFGWVEANEANYEYRIMK